MSLCHRLILAGMTCLILLGSVQSFSSILVSTTDVGTKIQACLFLQTTPFQEAVHQEPQVRPNANEVEPRPSSRRSLFQKTLVASGVFATATWIVPRPSLALKERNEQLCATGFFTNFLEYRCTEIGDISDEGQKTTFSGKDAGAADSLLDKLNLMDAPAAASDDTAKDGSKQPQQQENADYVTMK